MKTFTDPPTAAETMRRLTGPGGEFELTEEDVRGARMRVFKNRGRALHEVVAASRQWGERDYIVTASERISFADHADQVCAFARYLTEERGVRPGDRVAIAAANSPRWIVAFWAVVSVGAVATAFNAWWSRREMEHACDLAEPLLVIADDRRAETLAGSRYPVLSLERDVPEATRRHAGAPLPSYEGHEDDPAVVVFTSGTTGKPKGALHSHRNLMSVIEYQRLNDALAAELGSSTAAADRRHLLALPLFHIAGLHNLAVPRLATGSTVVMHQGAFNVEQVLTLIERERVTNWGAVPTMAHRLLEHGDLERYDLSSLDAFSLASAPSSPAFKQRLRQHLPVAADGLVDSFGLTETSTAVAVATPEDMTESPGTQGRPIAPVDVEIRDPEGERVPDGQEGEVCVRSAFNMLGYLQDEAATRAALRADGWLHTGDFGTMEQGRLTLSHRRSDLILRGGENVYPREIESVLAEHAAVGECAVVGRDHADLGQEVCAVVVPHSDATVTQDELREYVAERLAHFKVPAHWRIQREALPRNTTGKVLRPELLQLLES